MKVLIVDDNPDYLLLFKKAFNNIPDASVFYVRHAEDAIELVDSHFFDLIIIDIYLVGHSGFEVINEITTFQNSLNSKIVIYSSSSISGNIESVHKVYSKSLTTPVQLLSKEVYEPSKAR